MGKIKNIQEVQRCKSNLVTRSTTKEIQWTYDDGDYNIIRMRKKLNEISSF